MQNQPKLSALCLGMIAAATMLTSTASLAANYKGDYKNEAPMPVSMPCDTLRDGFYVGLDVGYDMFSTRHSVATAPAGALGTSFSANPVLAANGWIGGLNLGYGQYWNNFYLGAEIFARTSGASQNYTVNAATAAGTAVSDNAKFDVGSSYGISVLPGVKLNNASLLYVRLGYNGANMRARETLSSTVAGVTTSVSNSNSGYRSGFEYGLGMETLLYQNWSLRGDFSHVNYNSFSNAYGTKFSPSDNKFMLGVLYHFM